MVVKIKWLCELLGVKGIMLFPFCIVNSKSNKNLVRHEQIHFKQATELWVIPFYIMYLIDYLKKRKQYKHVNANIRHFVAYRAMYFELEAFMNDHKEDYLKTRPRFNWKKYK
jgi:hypothetical protein